MKRLIGKSSLLIFISIMSVFCLNAEDSTLREYRLINADQLIINKIQGEYISNLFGNVHFFYGDTEFFCDKADIFELKKLVRMYGNVEVYDDTLSLKAEYVDYFREEERLFLRGDVLVTEVHMDSTFRTFEADEVEYFRNSREFFAKNNVRTYDERENVHGNCGELKYFLNDGYGFLIKEPVISIADKDTFTVSAEKIEYFENYKKVAATFNVRTFSKDFVMTSDFLLYFADEEKAVYLGEPNFTSDFADATAKEFRILFKEQKIKSAILQDSCFVMFSDKEKKPKASWAKGDVMEFTFDKGNISFCKATGNVTSYFLQEATISRDFSANNAEGEYLTIEMALDNKIKMISMKEKVHGIYKFKHNNW